MTASEDGGVANNGEHPPAKPSIPLVPKSYVCIDVCYNANMHCLCRRDPNAVLKALSSTIEPVSSTSGAFCLSAD